MPPLWYQTFSFTEIETGSANAIALVGFFLYGVIVMGENLKRAVLLLGVGTERDQWWEKVGGKGGRLWSVEHVVEKVGMGLWEEGEGCCHALRIWPWNSRWGWKHGRLGRCNIVSQIVTPPRPRVVEQPTSSSLPYSLIIATAPPCPHCLLPSKFSSEKFPISIKQKLIDWRRY